MDENLIGYLLDALDDRTRRQVEAYLEQHPAAREKLAHFKHALPPIGNRQRPPHTWR
jgi:anti-sigma factor RsiW